MDITVVSPFAAAHAVAAAHSVGDAASRAEQLKVAFYGDVPAENDVLFTPFGMDVLGALGPAAIELLRPLARAWGWRKDIGPSRAVPLVAHRIIAAGMEQIASMLVANIDPHGSCQVPPASRTAVPAPFL